MKWIIISSLSWNNGHDLFLLSSIPFHIKSSASALATSVFRRGVGAGASEPPSFPFSSRKYEKYQNNDIFYENHIGIQENWFEIRIEFQTIFSALGASPQLSFPSS